MKMTKKFGVIIRIIELCFVDLANFLLIILIELFAFTIIFSILFEDVNILFGDIFLSLRTSNYFKLFYILRIILFYILTATSMLLGNFDT
jgi:hypothetical protein